MSTKVIFTEQNGRAIVEAWAEYHGKEIVSIRIVARRKQLGRLFIVDGIEPCRRDDCREGRLVPCEKRRDHITTVDTWLKHCLAYCHNWHEASVRRLMREVLATYDRKPTPTRSVGVPRGSIRPHYFSGVIPA